MPQIEDVAGTRGEAIQHGLCFANHAILAAVQIERIKITLYGDAGRYLLNVFDAHTPVQADDVGILTHHLGQQVMASADEENDGIQLLIVG